MSTESSLKSVFEGLLTPRQFIEVATVQFEAAGLFYGHGTERAVDEAAFIVAAVIGDDVLDDKVVDRAVSNQERENIVAILVQRIIARKPAANLLNEAWFAGLKFFVNEDVLIPRSPIAELIERQLVPWVEPEQVHSILDLGTGSGCIAIAAAIYFQNSRVLATDVSESALKVARRNIGTHQLGARVETRNSDLFENISGRYDIIFTNPPYVDAPALAKMPKEYEHEPILALTGGEDGLLYARKIIQRAKAFLSSTGVLVLEVGASRVNFLEAFKSLSFVELDLVYGGEGVFLIEARYLPN